MRNVHRWLLWLFILLNLCCHGAMGRCTSSLQTLADTESSMESISLSETRQYNLCPQTTYIVGLIDHSNDVPDGESMLPLRSNMHVRCGTTGKRDEQCIVNGGSIQVDGTSKFGITNDDRIDNVIIEGITFEDAALHSVFLTKPGNVRFVDCVFQNHVNTSALVLMDFFDPDTVTNELSVTFEDCLFMGNTFWPGIFLPTVYRTYIQSPSHPAIVVANGRQNTLIIQHTDFVDNDMVTDNNIAETNSFLIESYGPLSVLNSCFEKNNVGVSPVATYHNTHMFSNNHLFLSSGSHCDFASVFETMASIDQINPECEMADATICATKQTFPPTPSPSAKPTMVHSGQPTIHPTRRPTREPSLAPSAFPSLFRSMGPSPLHSNDPTSKPTFISASPSEKPIVPSTPPPRPLQMSPARDYLETLDESGGVSLSIRSNSMMDWLATATGVLLLAIPVLA